MEKEILCANTNKYLHLHDHFVHNYYLTTKSQPPDFATIANIIILLMPS